MASPCRSAARASIDSLTRLPNRSAFVGRLTQALGRPDAGADSVAVVLFDLDNFKVVNDAFGHRAGDRLLQAVAERLRGCLDQPSLLARLGGDEFGVLLEHLPRLAETSALAERVAAALRPAFVVDGHDVYVSTSVGIATNRSADDPADDLVRYADLALYEAKRKGRARWKLFDASMTSHALARLTLESQLRAAIQHQEFLLLYQ